MHVEKIPFEDTHTFSPFFMDYVKKKESLKAFYNRYPSPENALDQLIEKGASFPESTRSILTAALREQYQSVKLTDAVEKNIDLLEKKTTFTVTTGHQLNLFTGPLYFIYKIVTVINTCRLLQELYPKYTFVPVYWMASEDHDYDEIKYFWLNGRKYTWNTNQAGAVGRFSISDIQSLLNEVPGEINVFKKAYTTHATLRQAVRDYVHALFGKEGLVVVDGDDRNLKKLFIPVIEDDLFKNATSSLVSKTNAALEKAGYKPQVHCRDINLFYLDNGIRGRLEKTETGFRVVESELSFTTDELKKLIRESPEKFSPNVILRPLYQEMILPNLAYAGGPAEVVYWLQLKAVFDHYLVPFPMVMPRNFAMIIVKPLGRKFEKTGLNTKDLFLPKEQLFSHAVQKFSTKNLSLNGEKETIIKRFELIRNQAEYIDKTLGPMVSAETKRALKSLEKIEKKLLRAEKRNQSDRLQQIESIKDALFPNGSPQERVDNFLTFYQTDPMFIHSLLHHFDPFENSFYVFRYT